MQKQPPSLGKLVTIAAFALSCFGLLLFLWLSFGGATVLRAKRYEFRVEFPQAIQLAAQADVRIAGVSIGKVVSKGVDTRTNQTIATVDVDPRYAPIHVDDRAILREKTLLGETYIELTPGSRTSPMVPDGGMLANSNVTNGVQLDQVIQALDPVTRQAFRNWQQDLALASAGHGQDLNAAFGNLPHFVATAGDVLDVLNAQSQALSRLVRNTGVTFQAVSQNQQQLRNLVTGVQKTFSATAAEQSALASTFQIFPTFLDESKATFVRLKTFALDAGPLLTDLRPALHDLAPTLHDVRLAAPDLRATFQALDPVITASAQGLPAFRSVLDAIAPLLANLDPFLEQLNPILQWLEFNQPVVGDFLANPATPLAAETGTGPMEMGHYLRQYSPIGASTLSLSSTRGPSDRGNAYVGGNLLRDTPTAGKYMINPNFDCNPSGGPRLPTEGLAADPGCVLAGPLPFQGNTFTYTHVGAGNYGP